MDVHKSGDDSSRKTWITVLVIVGVIVLILVLVGACGNSGATDYCPDDDYVLDPTYDDDECEGDSHSGGGGFFFFGGIGGGGSSGSGSNSSGSGSDFRGGGSGFGK
ncbi:hypothetical protein AB0I72_10745 [Nocardiopsis sp. NPDC049922]|uniref:hypothetical protein n=1 Tax=Nocardiopsis sp. NPDC049922 TaxID=3155157 RepID=UPI0033E7EB93